MMRKVATRYIIYWNEDLLEEFHGLQNALNARNKHGGDSAPSIYAVLDDGLMILLK